MCCRSLALVAGARLFVQEVRLAEGFEGLVVALRVEKLTLGPVFVVVVYLAEVPALGLLFVEVVYLAEVPTLALAPVFVAVVAEVPTLALAPVFVAVVYLAELPTLALAPVCVVIAYLDHVILEPPDVTLRAEISEISALCKKNPQQSSKAGQEFSPVQSPR